MPAASWSARDGSAQTGAPKRGAAGASGRVGEYMGQPTTDSEGPRTPINPVGDSKAHPAHNGAWGRRGGS
eukprot:4978414-Alexandrium_andersonii.AAC.1